MSVDPSSNPHKQGAQTTPKGKANPSGPKARHSASKKLLKGIPPGAEILQGLNGLKEMDDRSAAIVGASILQAVFEKFLQSKMRELHKEDMNRLFDASQGGIISNFASQIRIAHALSWIDDAVYGNLLLINDIRNVFAHSLHQIDFNHADITTDCMKLPQILPLTEELKSRASFCEVCKHGCCHGFIV